LAKDQKQQAVQRRREKKAIARNARNAAKALRKAQRIADKEAKGAQKQAELVAKASNKGQRRILKKKKEASFQQEHPESSGGSNTAEVKIRENHSDTSLVIDLILIRSVVCTLSKTVYQILSDCD
jgi:hypothetical protein